MRQGVNPSLLKAHPPAEPGLPSPCQGGSRTALTSAKTHHPPLPHQAMSPQCDTNPLTRLVHMYYIHPRLARHTPKPKEEPKTQGEAQPWPRGLNVQAHPKGRPTRRPTAQAKAERPPTEDRHLLIPKAPAIPSPAPRRWKAHRLYAAGPVLRRPCRCNASHHRMRLSRPIARRFPG